MLSGGAQKARGRCLLQRPGRKRIADILVAVARGAVSVSAEKAAYAGKVARPTALAKERLAFLHHTMVLLI